MKLEEICEKLDRISTWFFSYSDCFRTEYYTLNKVSQNWKNGITMWMKRHKMLTYTRRSHAFSSLIRRYCRFGAKKKKTFGLRYKLKKQNIYTTITLLILSATRVWIMEFMTQINLLKLSTTLLFDRVEHLMHKFSYRSQFTFTRLVPRIIIANVHLV